MLPPFLIIRHKFICCRSFKIKSVQGLGDRSAYGLPDEYGIIIIDAGINSLLSRSGFASKDVIRTLDGKAVKNVEELLCAMEVSKGTEPVEVGVMRNQELSKILLIRH